MKRAQGRTREGRYAEAARAIITEATVEKVEYHDRGLEGKACPSTKWILVPRPTTRRRLYVLAHECGHVALKHLRKEPRHRQEYEAERWAHAALRRNGVAVPRVEMTEARVHVAQEIRRAIARGAKSIDRETLNWCKRYHSVAVRLWLADGRSRWDNEWLSGVLYWDRIDHAVLPAPDEQLIAIEDKEQDKDRVHSALKRLTFREREVLRLRYGIAEHESDDLYGLQFTLHEVGRLFKISRERVRAIQARAEGRLAKMLVEDEEGDVALN